jgi:hypothetical protein
MQSRHQRVRLRHAEGNVGRRPVKSGRRGVRYDQGEVRFIWRRDKLCFRRGDLGLAAMRKRHRQMKSRLSGVKFVRSAVQCRGSRWHGLNCAGNQRSTRVHQKSYFFDFLSGPADIFNIRDYRSPSIRNLFHCICRQLAAAALCNY